MSRHVYISPAIALCLALLLASIVTACSGATPDGEILVQERCSRCHSLLIVQNAKKTEAEWRTTVEQMVSYGTRLSSSEQEAVIRYLIGK
jgi:hypothetical protein